MLTAYSFRSPHNTWGASLDVTWLHQVTGDEYWMHRRHFPSFGFKFDLGFTPYSICGNRLGVAGVLRTPLLPWLDGDVVFGLSTYTKPNYVTGDTANVYISTPLTCLIDFGLVAHLDNRSYVALRLVHSSNGAIRQPNRGLNYFRLEMGMALDGNTTRKEPASWIVPAVDFEPYHEVGVMVAPSLASSRYMLQKEVYFCYDVSLNYEYHHTPAIGFGGTVDFWYNCSHTWQIEFLNVDYHLPFYLNAMAFVEGFWGALSIKGGVGAVLLASDRINIPICERLAAYYNFGNNYAGIGINALAGQAQFVEWSFGRRFPINKKK